MLIRIGILIMALLFGTFCGFNNAEKLKKRVDLCAESEKMIQLCEIMIRSSGMDVYKLVSRLKNENYRELSFINELSENYDADEEFRVSWKNALGKCRDIGEEEKRILMDIGNFLGSTDISGQLSGMAVQYELMHNICEKRRAELLQKGRLYRSIGVLAGLTVGIMII